MTASLLYPAQCMLGEGPIWHERKKKCFWVDIDGGKLFSYDFDNQLSQSWSFPQKVTMVIESTGDHLILALDTSIVRFTPETEKLETILVLEQGVASHRCNDGASDCRGRLWAGTMHRQHLHEAGSLYCIDTDYSIHKKVEKVSISNGLLWSLDNKRMYYIDSPTQKIQSYLFDEITGAIVFEKIVVDVPIEMGTPDGMTIDEAGMLWVAQWNGFGVYRWNPQTGELLDKIELPVPQVSSCVFAGTALNKLVITTARENMDDAIFKQYPQSGNVFVASPNVKGVPAFQCAL